MYTILRTLYNATKPVAQRAAFHLLAQRQTPNLLPVTNVVVTQSYGFKVKAMLKKRCKDCYFVKRENRLFVICNTHPRHKQMQLVKKEKYTWILSHATQGKIRPW
ncbi:hypothetical protein RN001_010416 [Aquatica leii]|uniref:Ribosomal protein n=1 Tax=Aquatica leii TaxID=1421715 RepID=A0AAN7Q390_9COLE|nr:hypothetical protein RN001_010416 [Aquatica leii]